jgi:small-conductance mechanosensitive channel
MTFKEFLEYNFIDTANFQLNTYHVLAAFFVLIFARILLWIIGRLAVRYLNRKHVDPGRSYAFMQILKYVIYTGAILIAMEAMGISVTLLMGGAAALLVGVGLGLQQTFNDLISGIILLIEGSVEVGDIIEIDGLVGSVTEIGIRTSKVETRDRISIVIPNSKLVVDKAINWSHNAEPTRFQVNVGVAYNSDIDLVTNLLLQAAKEHKEILKTPQPLVQFRDFGNSSLDFSIHFFSTEYLRVVFIRSELRYRILQLFREHGVEIPFPQQDIWFRNAESLNAIHKD